MEEEKKKDSETTEEEKEQEEMSDAEEMEDDELFSDEDEFGDEQNDTWEQIKVWFQDNLRVILSVLIVALIAVGIYNYSKKPQEPGQNIEEQGIEAQQGEEQAQSDQSQTGVKVQNENDNKGQVVVKGGDQEKKDNTATEQKPEVQTPVEKTGEGYVAKADGGDGVTNLARKAAKDYLVKNPDDSITKEQKIYIEDYLRKHVSQGRIRVGDSRTFSDSLMKDAISKAKQLNAAQLKNLEKYSARVTNL